MQGIVTVPSAVRKRYLKPSTFWRIRQEIPPWLNLLMPLIGFGVPLLIWSVLSYGGWVTSTFLPTPTAVLQAGWRMLTEEKLIIDILSSTGRVLAGFSLAAIVGIPVGIAMGTFRSMEGLFNPIVGTVRYMPVAAFVPLIVIWIGLGEDAKAAIIFLGIVLYNAMMVADAVKFIPDEMLDVAYTLGASRREVFFNVIMPAVFPSILDTLRVNIAGAWNFLVISELIAAQTGLGFKIVQSQRYLQTDKVLFCILVIGLIGLLTDYGLTLLSKKLTPWADQSRG
ncbi:MAG: ABC transporter permease [Oculatellaceae cyanobacterium Prado106]|jgi:NitT/TauT family transport system permease protein|nr:ABC transporter permease [Oculatellaceae cyanobacterium Prado106]